MYNILSRHSGAISRRKSDLGDLKTSQHFINTGEARLIRVPVQRLPYHQIEEARKEIETMLASDVIEASELRRPERHHIIRKATNRWTETTVPSRICCRKLLTRTTTTGTSGFRTCSWLIERLFNLQLVLHLIRCCSGGKQEYQSISCCKHQ